MHRIWGRSKASGMRTAYGGPHMQAILAQQGRILCSMPLVSEASMISQCKSSTAFLFFSESRRWKSVYPLCILPEGNCLRKPPLNMEDILYHFPALAPPPAMTSNFVNPQSQTLGVILADTICLFLIIPISCLRFYKNIWIKGSLKAGDGKHASASPVQLTEKISRVCICCCKQSFFTSSVPIVDFSARRAA